MHRTQLYLDGDLWNALRASARKRRTTISALVRQAARERYLGNLSERRHAMLAFIGIRSDRSDRTDSAKYIRTLRRDTRLERLNKP